MGRHLCAMDCERASRCKWVLSKKKEPEKFKGLVVKLITYKDVDKVQKTYRVIQCPHYKIDNRSNLAKPPKPVGKRADYWWTDAERAKVAEMYGKYTYAEIAKEIGRSEGSLCRVVKMLKEEGII